MTEEDGVNAIITIACLAGAVFVVIYGCIVKQAETHITTRELEAVSEYEVKLEEGSINDDIDQRRIGTVPKAPESPLEAPLIMPGASHAHATEGKSKLMSHSLGDSSSHSGPVNGSPRARPKTVSDINEQLTKIAGLVYDGAGAFLWAEYKYIGVFIVGFSLVLLLLLGSTNSWDHAAMTMISFVIGSVTSIMSGFVGMRVAVIANSRTAVASLGSIGAGYNIALKAGAVIGFAIVCSGLFVLYLLIHMYKHHFDGAFSAGEDGEKATQEMFETLAGYGLGGSAIAMFGRVGGGIYTKAADVGADLAGKLDNNWDEDDPRNPAVIADNVGDNVGDIAGMGADLFGSFAEATCAAMVICAQSKEMSHNIGFMLFPLAVASMGILCCVATFFIGLYFRPVQVKADVEKALKEQLLISTVLMTPGALIVCASFLPGGEFECSGASGIKWWHMFMCLTAGLWSGLGIGYITEYYTSSSYAPVQKVARACETGAATNIIHGLALGYLSTIIPVFLLAGTMFMSYGIAKMFGIATAALGILSTLAIGLTIDSYGPICDNAGGLAEMSHMPAVVRDRTDCLDAAGNTTAAIGKGFAIGSAALVSLALFGAFVDVTDLGDVGLIGGMQFAGLVVGAMIPYWFSAMCMESVGMAAHQMVMEVRRQVERDRERGCSDKSDEDYAACISIATDASLKEMLPPGALVILTPIITGFLFGPKALAGLLLGSLSSGVSMAISASNSGGAWDNTKKFIASGGLAGHAKGGDAHHASIVGDTVGDPLKDTSGPALNIVMKLMAIISLVFAPAFPSQEKGGLLVQLFT